MNDSILDLGSISTEVLRIRAQEVGINENVEGVTNILDDDGRIIVLRSEDPIDVVEVDTTFGPEVGVAGGLAVKHDGVLEAANMDADENVVGAIEQTYVGLVNGS